MIGDTDDGYTVRLLTGRAEYGDYYVGDDIFVYFPTLSERILEEDVITVYGESAGLYTYETILGAERTIPLLKGHSFALVG